MAQTSEDMGDDYLIPGVRDFYLLLIIPIVAYWMSATIFHIFDCQRWFQAYKIHTYEESQKRNRATLRQVFCQVLAQQFIQVAFALYIDQFLQSPSNVNGPALEDSNTWINQLTTTFTSLPPTVKLGLQIALAVVIADFWQYFWHRIFHTNKFLYKHVHSVHHRLYVPYSFGALYSSLVEAFIVDTIGTTVTFYLSGLAVLPATCFASLSIIKSVNDHSGYRFPFNPFDYLTTNTTDFHDVHHQNWGMKYNYSQVYLTIWDDLLGTTMPAKEVAERRKVRGNFATQGDMRRKTE